MMLSRVKKENVSLTPCLSDCLSVSLKSESVFVLQKSAAPALLFRISDVNSAELLLPLSQLVAVTFLIL